MAARNFNMSLVEILSIPIRGFKYQSRAYAYDKQISFTRMHGKNKYHSRAWLKDAVRLRLVAFPAIKAAFSGLFFLLSFKLVFLRTVPSSLERAIGRPQNKPLGFVAFLWLVAHCKIPQDVGARVISTARWQDVGVCGTFGSRRMHLWFLLVHVRHHVGNIPRCWKLSFGSSFGIQSAPHLLVSIGVASTHVDFGRTFVTLPDQD
jgi:hypothetical protein